MLPEALADGRGSGMLCRDCLSHMFRLGFHAMEAHFGPVAPGLPVEQLLDDELMWVEAALQEPRTLDLEEIRQRQHQLWVQKYEVSADRMRVDEDTLRRWLEPPPERGSL
jgi:hypothetical protein